jgi:hypothetical protein
MKKTLTTLSVLLFLILGLFILAPLLLKKQIKDTVTTEINGLINADFNIDDISLNFISNFPNASIELENIIITNKQPFKGDTLVLINSVQLQTSIGNLLSKKVKLDNFSISNAIVNLKLNLDNVSNYDIMYPSETSISEEPFETATASTISLHVEDYSFNNIQFNYLDERSQLSMVIKNFNHRGKGTFSSQDILLKTFSSIEEFTFSSGNIEYLKSAKVLWDAKVNINLHTLKVELLENLAELNDLSLSFHGFVQPSDPGIEMDLKFDSKGSKFKSLLSLIPSGYSSNFDAIKANGELNFNGAAAGLYSNTTIPKFNVNIHTNNASFQYPDLPKAITNIYIDTQINNTTGQLDDTKIALKRFDLKIDKDIFQASSYLSNLTSNPHIKAKLKGIINLGNLTKAYPLELEETLEGILNFNLQSEFTQQAIEEEKYSTIKNSGFISLKNMTVATEMLPHPISISSASLRFTPKNFILESFIAKTASSDFNAKGTLTNLIGFVFGNKPLTGNFTVNSNNFNTFDFLSQTEVSSKTESKDDIVNDSVANSEVKIPENIHITTTLNAKTVSYDNIILSNMRGTIKIKDQKAIFENTTAKLLGGTIALKGDVDTKPTPSKFAFSMSLQELDIVASFTTIELFSSIAPFAKALNGKMSTSLDLTGRLDADLFPEMNSLNGNGISKLDVEEIDPKKSTALGLLESNFNFVDFTKLDMKKIQTAITFENSSITFKPFKIAVYDGIPIQMEGSHSFDNTMNYNLSTQVPVKFLGKDVTNLVSGLSKEEVDKMKVPITINLNGDVTKPNVVPDYTSALKAVSGKVIESQKNKLLNSLFKENKKEGDSASKGSNNLEKAAKNLLKGLFK